MTAQGTAGPATVSGRVSKRFSRLELHRYRSGFLKVAPKRHEKKITLDNQRQSPLLRLPPELRNMIWAYTLGNTVYRGHGYRNLRDREFAAEDPSVSPRLLETCRQIYSETAMLPFRLNTFSLGSRHQTHFSFEAMGSHQRRQIRFLRLELTSLVSLLCWSYDFKSILKNFPSLKCIQIFSYEFDLKSYERAWPRVVANWRTDLDLVRGKSVVRWSEESRPERVSEKQMASRMVHTEEQNAI